ncbi:MAG: reverse gyrase [Desulfurococcales archaeon]|nr:reverse gyrase [Desulfurococcales archaeon]
MSKPPTPARAVYRHSCPNCLGPNTEERLSQGLPCERCLSEPPKQKSILSIYEALKREGTLREYRELARLEEESERLIEFFRRAVGSRPWGAQRTWARRLVRGDSFSIVAPTGVGKTTFGLAASLFLARERKGKSYIILPTTALVMQAEKKILGMMSLSNTKARVVVIHSKQPRKVRNENLSKLESGDFDILITTAAFARTRVDLVSRHRYRLVFVDDVDAVLKSAKSVNVILRITGFTEEDMELGMELLRLQRRRAAILARLTQIQAQGTPRPREEERLKRELDKIERSIEKIASRIEKARKRAASLIVSTATGRPRGSRVRLFRSLLNFEAGGRAAWSLRRVYDLYTYPENDVYEKVVEIVSDPLFRGGGLVYVPIDHGIDGAERLAEMIRERGLRAEAYHSKSPPGLLDAFASGDIDILVGVANYYGTLVRGLDLPERVRYAVFAGVPRHKFPADVGEPHPARLIRLLALLVEAPIEDIREQARRHMARLRDILRRLSPAALRMITEKVLAGDVDGPGSPAWIVAEAYQFLRQALEEEDVWEYLKTRTDIAIEERHGNRYLLIADVPTYIQASGRTSRLYAGGITLGVSIVVVDNEAVFNGLVRRMRFYVETEWRKLEDVDIKEIMRMVDEDRERVRRLRRGEVEVPDLVKTALLVVESPNKARTIAGFFGQPSIRILPEGTRVYEVTTGNLILSVVASGGHVYDLAPKARKIDEEIAGITGNGALDIFSVLVTRKKPRSYTPVYTSIKRCMNCGYQYTADTPRCPVCGSTRVKDSRGTVADIRRVAWEVDQVLIGTDPDVEGEKIGWDIAMLLRPYSRSLLRVEFHEVTKRAITEALENPREFNSRLVDAQVVRRIEDRWIGYTLSPILWCHFWPHYYCRELLEIRRASKERRRCEQNRYYYNLSAGRVQTPVLGWVVERTRLNRELVFQVMLSIRVDGAELRATVKEDELEGDVSALGQIYKYAKPREKGRLRIYPEPVLVEVDVLERTESTMPPPPPYTTDTMIADASRFLGLGAPETMRLAQNLFEWGLITYHRTDSTRVSEKGIQVAREWITEKFPNIAEKIFKPRSWGKGGAHEAIRPTRPIDAETLWNLINEGVIEIQGVFTRNHLRLYDLIFRRFMASQMREADVERTRYKLTVVLYGFSLETEGITRIGREGDPASRGFTLVWEYIHTIPRLDPGKYEAVLAIARVGKAPLYTQGELVLEMKKRGIGRPSTYAKIVDTLLRRRYITRAGGRRSDMVASTPRGEYVYRYLSRDITYFRDYFSRLGSRAMKTIENVPRLVSEERTRELEEKMDKIERGETRREEVLDEIYEELEGLSVPISAFISGLSRLNVSELEECLRGSIAVKVAGGEE